MPLKDYQQGAGDAAPGAERHALRRRRRWKPHATSLRILGLTDEAITAFQDKGRINPETTIYAPIAGTVVQRKIGPGQYVSAGASRSGVRDRRSLDGVAHRLRARDRSCCTCRSARKSASPCWRCRAARSLARINYVATALDPATRRLLVRATHGQQQRSAEAGNVRQRDDLLGLATSRRSACRSTALIYEGDQVRVWVARDDKSIELRTIKTGLDQWQSGRGPWQPESRANRSSPKAACLSIARPPAANPPASALLKGPIWMDRLVALAVNRRFLMVGDVRRRVHRRPVRVQAAEHRGLSRSDPADGRHRDAEPGPVGGGDRALHHDPDRERRSRACKNLHDDPHHLALRPLRRQTAVLVRLHL